MKKALYIISALMVTACALYAALPSEPSLSPDDKPIVSNSNLKPAKKSVKATTTDEINTPPYLATFVTEDEFNKFTVINANNDQKSSGKECTWYYNEDLQTARYSYSGSNQADDWLITPAIALDNNCEYNLTVNCKNFKSAYYGDYEEKFEVYLGTAPTVEGMTKEVMPSKTVRGGSFKNFTKNGIAVDNAGTYYLGIHCISDAYRGELDVKYISIDIVPKAAAPAECTKLLIYPDENGDAKATVAFNAPSKSYGGSTLTSNMTVKIRRNGSEIVSLENVTPGQAISYDDQDIPNGDNTYDVITYNEAGIGAVTTITAYVGVDIPDAVENIRFSEPNAGTMTISWDPVANVGPNGYTVNPEKVGYAIFSTQQDGSSLSIDEQIGYVFNETSFSFANGNDLGSQKKKYWVVVPVNLAGQGSATAAGVYTGKPHSTPFTETLTETGFQVSTWTYNVAAPKYVILDLTNQSSDEDGNALQFYSPYEGLWGYITPGKITLKNTTNPLLSFDAKGEDNIPVHVNIYTPDGNCTSFDEFTPSAEYASYRLNLSQFLDQRWIRFEVYTDFQNAGTVYFDNFKLYDVKSKDLSIKLRTPSQANLGTCNSKVTAVVKNEGSQPISNFTIKITSGNTLVASELIAQEVASMSSFEKEFTLPFNIVKEEGTINLEAEVILEGDEDESNNSTSKSLAVRGSKLPTPTNVALSESSNSADLTWNAPESDEAVITEDFEDQETFPAFSVGGIKNQFGSFGEWTLFDGDNTTNYSFQNFSFENSGIASAWQVFNPGEVKNLLDEYDNYTPHSGDQYLAAWCPNSGDVANNWIISPTLSGDEQTISFYYMAMTDQYGDETFEVLASSTDNNPESFSKVKELTCSSIDWEMARVTLPEGSKYFAIRHTTTDVFGMMIDDVTYTEGAKVVAAYNLYLDGNVIATIEPNSETYKFENVSAAEGHFFGISAVYDDGQESSPVYVSNASGVNEIFSNSGINEYPAYNVLGQRVSPNAKGIVIINGKKYINK